jgi:hypothetical protein
MQEAFPGRARTVTRLKLSAVSFQQTSGQIFSVVGFRISLDGWAESERAISHFSARMLNRLSVKLRTEC